MDTGELTRALHDATENLEPRVEFTEAVLRGGRRRRTRRRLGVVTGAVVAAALATVSGLALASAPPVQTGNPLLDAPTSGNLAGDTQFLNDAVAAWEAGKEISPNADRGIFDDLRGDPHVYWAGNTPAGRAAVVAQSAYLHPHDGLGSEDTNQSRTLVGLLATDPADGTFKLVNDQYDATAGRFMFGDGDRTVLIIDRGAPLFVAYSTTFEQGKINTEWQRPSRADGVAVMELPEGTTPTQVAAFAGEQPPAGLANVDGSVILDPSSWYLSPDTIQSQSPDHTGLPWVGTELAVGDPGGPQIDPNAVFFDEVSLKLSNGSAVGNYTSTWHIRAGLPDGRVAVVGDNQTGGTPCRFYAVLVSPDGAKTVVQGDDVDANAVLPVKFRLTDGQGWVVAAKGQSLSHRTDGDWSAPAQDAALIPDAATQVKIGETVVDLPR